jgi:hypothetical protein
MLAALRERVGQTPVSAAAEERDILEGIVVSLARSANAAAASPPAAWAKHSAGFASGNYRLRASPSFDNPRPGTGTNPLHGHKRRSAPGVSGEGQPEPAHLAPSSNPARGDPGHAR